MLVARLSPRNLVLPDDRTARIELVVHADDHFLRRKLDGIGVCERADRTETRHQPVEGKLTLLVSKSR